MRPALRRRPGSRGFLSAGTAVVLAVSSVAMVAGTGFKFGETKLRDGVTWIFNRDDGEVVRVNGSSGKVELKIALPGSKGKNLEIVQRDNAVLVVDPETSEVASLDVNGFKVAARKDFGTKDDFDVVLGDRVAYFVDRVGGTIQRVDPVDLEQIGQPVPAGEDLGEAVADDAGRLWLVRNATGEIIRIDPSGTEGLEESVRRQLAPAGARLEITLVDGGIVVTDAKTGKQWRLDADGADIGSIQVEVPKVLSEDPDDRVTPPASSGPYVPITVSDDDGRPAVVPPPAQPGGGGPVYEPVPLEVPDADYELPEPAVSLGDRIYVPVPDEGVLEVLDREGRYLRTLSVPGKGGFSLLLDDGRLWANDPDDLTALRIDADGTVTEVEKGAEDVPFEPPKPAFEPDEEDEKEKEEEEPAPPPPNEGGNQPGATTTTVPPATTTPVTPPTTTPITTPPTTTPVSTPATTTTTTAPAPTTPPPTVRNPDPPGAVTGLAATPADQAINLVWAPPTETGGAPIQGQLVTWAPAAASCGSNGDQPVAADATSASLSGLQNGCTYTVTVTAENRAGAGDPASVEGRPSATTPAAPAAPSVALQPADGSTVVSWTPPDLRGQPATGYVLTAVSNNGEHSWSQPLGADQTQVVVPGGEVDAPNMLRWGRTYAFTVAAVTQAQGEPSPPSAQVVPYTGPSGITLSRERIGAQQWRFTVQANWRGRVGTIQAAGAAQGTQPGDGPRTFDASIPWGQNGQVTFQACVEGAACFQEQRQQANPVPRFTGAPDPVWGPCQTNPDIPSDRVHENGYWQIGIDGGGEGGRNYITAVESTWAYAYGNNQPSPTQGNEGFGTPPTALDGDRIHTNGRRHYPNYTFFVEFRFHVQGHGWVHSGRVARNAPGC